MNNDLLRHWPLDPTATYLNHGAYGACPWVVLQEQSEWRARMERQPTYFNDKELEGHLDRARAAMAGLLGADADDLAFVPNATTGVSTVLRSLELSSGDEILTTDHEYNACRNAIRFVCARAGAREVVAPIPLPITDADEVVDAILARATPRTRLAVISLVTSPTGLVFPIGPIVSGLAERGIDALVDGAHAPGMLPLALDDLGAAWFTGNAHKWLCTPKGSAVLHVRRDRQSQMRPLVISHGANSPRSDRSRFRLEFDWGGTGDPSPYLVIPTALGFLEGLLPGGLSELQVKNRDLAIAGRRLLLEALGSPAPLAPESMLGSLAAVELPPLSPDAAGEPSRGDATYPPDPLHDTLWNDHRIEVPVYPWPHSPADSQPRHRLLRVSAQAYNSIDDYQRLAEVLGALL